MRAEFKFKAAIRRTRSRPAATPLGRISPPKDPARLIGVARTRTRALDCAGFPVSDYQGSCRQIAPKGGSLGASCRKRHEFDLCRDGPLADRSALGHPKN